MPIPKFHVFMLPLLRFAADGAEHRLADARAHLANFFGLSAEDRKELLPSGGQSRFDNRVTWARLSDKGRAS